MSVAKKYNGLTSSVAGAITPQLLVNENYAVSTGLTSGNARGEVTIANDSASVLYVKFGGEPSSSDYTFKMLTDDVLITEFKGAIYGVWASATGNARVTEVIYATPQ